MKRAFLFALIITSIFACNKKQEESSQEPNVVIEVYDAEQADSLDIAEESDNNGRFWSSNETNLPIGIVVTKDCAHSGAENENQDQKDNYVTIKQPNGCLTIRRDINEDLYLNLDKGDQIK